MEVVILNNADDVTEWLVTHFREYLEKKPDAVLGLATGSTPLAFYDGVTDLYKRGDVSLARVTTFNLDEYIGLAAGSPQSYRHYMNSVLFDKTDIDISRTFLPECPSGRNPQMSGRDYERSISNAGGIDLQLLGIGANGHIGFNEPSSSLASRTRVKTLTERTIADNSRLFDQGEFQPRLAMTMGIATILDARRVWLVATGKEKARAVQAAVEGPVTAMSPASALQLHERTSVIIDKAAASALAHADYYQWTVAENARIVEQYGAFPELD